MIQKVCLIISRSMAVIIIAAACVAMVMPQVSHVAKTSHVNVLLGIVMLGMGLMLRADDLRVVVSRPHEVMLGSALQFVVMPLLGWLLVHLFALPPELALGVLLVGCCPGGTASNVITFLAGGDLALSVGVTCLSTLLAPLLTPLFVWLLAGEMVDVDVPQMFLSIVQVVIVPIAVGVGIRRYVSSVAQRLATFLPAISVLAIAWIVLAVVATNQPRLLTTGGVVWLVVMLHNLLGFTLGYALARLCGFDLKGRVALSIEVGMQNSGLACSLATQHFPLLTMASVPGALFSVWHNIAGALAAKCFHHLTSKTNSSQPCHSNTLS